MCAAGGIVGAEGGEGHALAVRVLKLRAVGGEVDVVVLHLHGLGQHVHGDGAALVGVGQQGVELQAGEELLRGGAALGGITIIIVPVLGEPAVAGLELQDALAVAEGQGHLLTVHGDADSQLHPQPGLGAAVVGDGDLFLHRLAGHDALQLPAGAGLLTAADLVVEGDVDGAGGDDVGGPGVLREVGEGAGGQQRQDQDHRAGEDKFSLHGGTTSFM